MLRQALIATPILSCLVVSTALAQEYTLGVGDTVRVTVFGEPELSRESIVPPRCTIDVELIGAVDVCGRSTAQVAAEVRDRFANGYLVSPRVIVDVAQYGSQRVEVSGAIKTPGLIVLTGPMTLTQAVTTAGGPVDGNVVEVEHVRPGSAPVVYQLSQLYQSSTPVFLAGGDTVFLRRGRFVYLSGEVTNEGPVPYQEGLTLTQAISLAGGPTEFASTLRAIILNGKGERTVVKLAAVRNGAAPDPVLGPDDRVQLPRSWF